MTPKQEAAIRRHGEQLLALFPDAVERDPVRLCKKLRRLEVSAHRIAERMCCEDVPDADERFDSLLIRVGNILTTDRVWINRDPRGYALKVNLLDGERLHADWGGYGIIAPELDGEGF